MPTTLHVTNGDAVVPELAAAAGVATADVLVWRDVLHDGPVPDGLNTDELAQVRARHLTSRAWSHADDVEVSEEAALAMLRERDARLAPGAVFSSVAARAGAATRARIDRWLGGVHLGPGRPDWAWDATAARPVRLD